MRVHYRHRRRVSENWIPFFFTCSLLIYNNTKLVNCMTVYVYLYFTMYARASLNNVVLKFIFYNPWYEKDCCPLTILWEYITPTSQSTRWYYWTCVCLFLVLMMVVVCGIRVDDLLLHKCLLDEHVWSVSSSLQFYGSCIGFIFYWINIGRGLYCGVPDVPRTVCVCAESDILYRFDFCPFVVWNLSTPSWAGVILVRVWCTFCIC